MRNVLTIWITEVQKCRFSRILLTGSTCAKIVIKTYTVCFQVGVITMII